MAEVAVAITGASGAPYGQLLVQTLAESGHTVHLVVSTGGARVLAHELGVSVNPKAPDPAAIAPGLEERIVAHSELNYGATIASGSYPIVGMAVCPCSMGTLGRIAAGTGENLITRAADVCLKERRKLVLVPREMPLSLIHLENMTRLSRAGAVILPACPGFYHQPREVRDLTAFVVARVIEQLGLSQDLIERWEG